MEQRRREPLRARRAEREGEPQCPTDSDLRASGGASRPTSPRPTESQVGKPTPAPEWDATSGLAVQVRPIPAPVYADPPIAAARPMRSSGGRRFAAYVLDTVLLFLTLFIGYLIWSLVVWSKGQTPGKAILGMRCMSIETGRAATWVTMAVRECIYKNFLGNLSFGITVLVSSFMILGDSRQGIWDKMAKTVVVDDPNGCLIS